MKIRSKRLRLPVWSWLTWAWVASAAAGTTFGAYSLLAKTEGPTRVALAINGVVERYAPPVEQPPATRSVLHAAAAVPALRDGEEPAVAIESEDVFAALPEAYDNHGGDPLFVEEDNGIIITVDGAPARNPGQKAVAAELASLTRPGLRLAEIDAGLLQKTALGSIPKIGKDGRKVSRYYARPYEGKASANRVGVIVGGLGLNPALTERAIEELPPEITLAFAPYAKELDFWTARAREAGHEIMIELPMEGYGGSPAALGPAALLTERSAAENQQRLDWLLSRFGGYFGATNYLGGKFSADGEAMAAVLKRLDDIGVAYVDDTGAARRALEEGANAGVVNRMIAPGPDGSDSAAARRDLAALETIAARDGAALGKAYAYDASIDAIVEWAGALEDRQIALAPASSVLQTRASR